VIVFAAAVAGIVAVVAPRRAWVAAAIRLGSTRKARRRDAEEARRDLPLLADLVALGVGAGLSFRAAVTEAADVVHPSLGEEILSSVRRRGAEGRNVGRLFSIAGRAAESGASIVTEANAYAEELRAQNREEALTRLRRLPVRLLFPLALLILPGFLLMTLGPTLSAGLQRLGI